MRFLKVHRRKWSSELIGFFWNPIISVRNRTIIQIRWLPQPYWLSLGSGCDGVEVCLTFLETWGILSEEQSTAHLELGMDRWLRLNIRITKVTIVWQKAIATLAALGRNKGFSDEASQRPCVEVY
jgi:hypothetical protein